MTTSVNFNIGRLRLAADSCLEEPSQRLPLIIIIIIIII